MTRRIGDVAPAGNSGDRVDFVDKKDLENVPLVISRARTAKGKNGVFWIAEAVREDTGEAVVFTGATVVDQQMAAVKEQEAFPVTAMLTMVRPDEGNPYWMLVDPPNTKDRTGEITELIGSHGLSVEQVQAECQKIREGAKVNDLSDEEYGWLLDALHELAAEKAAAADTGIPF